MKVDLSCPIELWEYVLPNEQSSACLFTFFNLGQRMISSIQITVTFFDANDEVLSRRVERPMALEATGRTPFAVSVHADGLAVEAVDLSIDKVWFEDGVEWRRQQDVRLVNYEPNELPPNRKLEQLRYVAGEDAVGFPSDQGSIWVCVCGRVNAAEEARCRRCDRDKDVVFDLYSPRAVQETIDRREAELEDLARQAREEASRQEFMRQDKARRKKRARRTRTIIITTTLVIAVFAYLFIVLGLPELKYQSAKSALATNDYTTARTSFEELMDYRDAEEMVKECDLRQATEYVSSGDMTKVDAAIDMLTGLGSYTGAPEMVQQARYEKGTLYLADKRYEDASAVFVSLGAFQDSVDKRNEADYALATQAMEAKDYTDAARRFMDLGTYLDSAALAKECTYRPALTLMSEGKYTEAAEMFASIPGYRDADEQRLQSIYQDALRAQLAGDPEYAAERFALLGNYEDSPEQMKHSTYLAANSARDAGKYDLAIKLYATFPDYLDSADQVKACTYLPAKALMTDGQYTEAADLFKQIPGYLDSDELYNQSIYLPAGEAFDDGDFAAAVKLYGQIPEYSDVAKRLPQAQYRLAEQQETEGEYETAAKAFAALGEYSDSADREKAALYAWAEEAFDDGEFEVAAERFEALDKYSNAQTRVKECAYEIAVKMLDAGEYQEAYDALTAIEEYDPAKEKAREAAYALGQALEKEGERLAASDAYALAGRYEDADTRRQENIYQYALELMAEERYQEAGETFNTITGYIDAKARRDEAYDMWLAGQDEQAKEYYDAGEYQAVIDLLKGQDMNALPKSYADLQTLYFDANLKIARQLVAEDKPLAAYTYLIAAESTKGARELLDKNIYKILGTWETSDGIRYAFYLNGTAVLNGKRVYFNMFNPYGISTSETEDPDTMVRTLSFSSSSETALQLREDSSGKTMKFTRVKGPEVSETNDAEGSMVLSEQELAEMENPVVDSIVIGGEEEAPPAEDAGEGETEDEDAEADAADG